MRISIFFLLLLAVCTVQSRYVTRVNEDDTVSAYETELENDDEVEPLMSPRDVRVFKGLFGDLWNVIKKTSRKLAQKVIKKIDKSNGVNGEDEMAASQDAQAFKSAYGARPNFEYDDEMEAPLSRQYARVFKGLFGDLWKVIKSRTRKIAEKVIKKIDKSNGVNGEEEMMTAQDDQDDQAYKSAFGVRPNYEKYNEMAALEDDEDAPAFKSFFGKKKGKRNPLSKILGKAAKLFYKTAKHSVNKKLNKYTNRYEGKEA